MDLGDLIPVLGIGFTIVCTVMAVAGAYVLGRYRQGEQKAASPRDDEARDRLDRVERILDALAVDVERIGEGQRFIVKVMGDSEQQRVVSERKNVQGRVITPH